MSTRSCYPIHGHGGMEKYIYFLAKYISRQGVNVEVVTTMPTSLENGQELENFKLTSLPVNITTITPFDFTLKYHFFSLKLMKYLEKQKFDILHAFGFTPVYYYRIDPRKPIIIQLFGNEPFKDKRMALRLWNYMFWYYHVYNMMHKVELIGSEGPDQSEEIKKLYQVHADKICEIQDGIEIEEISKFCDNPIIMRKNLNIQDDEIVFITVNRLAAAKRIDWIIQAFDEFSKVYCRSRLILVGSGTKETELKKLIAKLNIQNKVLHFKGIKDDQLFSLLKLSDLYINASQQKVLLISVLEAQAAGLPVLSVDSQEGHIRNWITGLQVKESIPEITAGMFNLIRSNRLKEMGDNAKNSVLSHDWNYIATKAISYYESLYTQRP